MCVKCDLGHPEACDNAAPEWLVEATEAVVPFLDDIAASAAGEPDHPTLEERDAYEDAERIAQAVVAVLDRLATASAETEPA